MCILRNNPNFSVPQKMPSPYFSHSVTPKNKTLLWNRIISLNLAQNEQWYYSEVFPYSALYSGLPSTLTTQSVDSVVLDIIGKNKCPFRMDAKWICGSSIFFVTYALRNTHVGGFHVATLYCNRTRYNIHKKSDLLQPTTEDCQT